MNAPTKPTGRSSIYPLRHIDRRWRSFAMRRESRLQRSAFAHLEQAIADRGLPREWIAQHDPDLQVLRELKSDWHRIESKLPTKPAASSNHIETHPPENSHDARPEKDPDARPWLYPDLPWGRPRTRAALWAAFIAISLVSLSTIEPIAGRGGFIAALVFGSWRLLCVIGELLTPSELPEGAAASLDDASSPKTPSQQS